MKYKVNDLLSNVQEKYREANHAPRVEMKGAKIIQVKPGETISLKATISDPDGNGVFIKWWQFVKVKGEATLSILNPTSAETKIQIPNDAKMGNEYHVVVEVSDDGVPALTRYQIIELRLQ